MPDPALLAAYQATTYFVDTPHGRLGLRVGERHLALDDLLRSLGIDSWAVVTAWNPRSQRLDDGENARRQANLMADVARRGWKTWPAEGVGDDGSWPPEASLFILNISRDEACDIGCQFHQHAVVWGSHGAAAELVWSSDR